MGRNDKRIDQLKESLNPLVNTDLFAMYSSEGTVQQSLDKVTDYLSNVISTPYVTGGTYTAGVTTFSNTYGDTFEVTGFNQGTTTYWTSGSTGDYSVKVINDTSTDATGDYSHAEGRGTTASGNSSHAEGESTESSGDSSHAEGESSQAIGASSHAEGKGSRAYGSSSHAEGQSDTYGIGSHAEGSSVAYADYSHSEGLNTIASGYTSHAQGNGTTASGDYSHAQGWNNLASGIGSHAEGFGTLASGREAHAEGANTIASGRASHAEGQQGTASGAGAHVEGSQGLASGDASHSEGILTVASGQNSHAEGSESTASGDSSHAEGNSTESGGEASHSEGYYTSASGDYSHAGGSGSIASGTTSFVHSTNSLVTGDRSVVLGGQNITGTTDDTVYVPNLNIGIIGSGTSVNNLGVDSSGNVIVGSSSSGGEFGVADSGGTYTYYSTFTLAIAAAVAGQTVEMFADVEETGSVVIALKNGVNINGNGHTYTLSVDDGTHAFTCSSATVELYNFKGVRTGRSNGSGGVTLNCFGGSVKAFGVLMVNTYGDAVLDGASIHGLHAEAYLTGFKAQYQNVKLYNCTGQSTGTGHGIFATYTVDCTGIAVSGYGIVGNGTHLNGTGISVSGIGMAGQFLTDCTGMSTSGVGINPSTEGRNCTGISVSGDGGVGNFRNSTLTSSSGFGLSSTGGCSAYNSYIQSTSSVTTKNADIYNSTVRCLWNNAGGHLTSTFSLAVKEILNSFLEVTNASAYCITGFNGSTWKWSNNSFKGATTPIDPTFTQGITNTSDSQGNILI
jgi:hypothetical protein